jgi:hypothetical protein
MISLFAENRYSEKLMNESPCCLSLCFKLSIKSSIWLSPRNTPCYSSRNRRNSLRVMQP